MCCRVLQCVAVCCRVVQCADSCISSGAQYAIHSHASQHVGGEVQILTKKVHDCLLCVCIYVRAYCDPILITRKYKPDIQKRHTKETFRKVTHKRDLLNHHISISAYFDQILMTKKYKGYPMYCLYTHTHIHTHTHTHKVLSMKTVSHYSIDSIQSL